MSDNGGFGPPSDWDVPDWGGPDDWSSENNPPDWEPPPEWDTPDWSAEDAPDVSIPDPAFDEFEDEEPDEPPDWEPPLDDPEFDSDEPDDDLDEFDRWLQQEKADAGLPIENELDNHVSMTPRGSFDNLDDVANYLKEIGIMVYWYLEFSSETSMWHLWVGDSV